MHRTLKIISVVFMLMESGCGNSIYYYQSDSFSLKLKGRASDASKPVQGSLGFKERVAIITPPKAEKDESVSLLSGFSFSKEEGFFGRVNIRSALVTGEAANNLPPDGNAIAGKVLQLKGNDIPGHSEIAKKVLDQMTQDNKEKLKTFIRINYCPSSLDDLKRTEYLSLTDLATYNSKDCTELDNILSKS
jgi:hypothetical protein